MVKSSQIRDPGSRSQKHQARLQNTDWKGDAKDGTVALVAGWTTKAKAKATEAQTKLVEFIYRQIEQVNAADVAPSA